MRAGKGRARRFGELRFVCAHSQSWALALLLLVLAGRQEECFRRGEKNVDTPAEGMLASALNIRRLTAHAAAAGCQKKRFRINRNARFGVGAGNPTTL